MRNRRRKYIKMLLMLLIFSGVLPFVYPWGQPWLRLDNISMPRLKQIGEQLPTLPDLTDSDRLQRSGQSVTVYRWRDKNGSWSFGSEPPAGVTAEQLSVDPDANLILGLHQNDEPEQENKQTVISTEGDEPTTLMGYSAEDVSKIMQSAKEARTAMENRYKQEQIIIEGQ